jgi:phenylacetate-CoA ligase
VPDHHVLLDGHVPPSAAPGTVFPAFPDPRRALGMALLAQLAETQWWPTERLRAWQLKQLALVLRHAATTTAWGRARFPDLARRPVTWERFAELPVLDRRAIQGRRAELVSDAVPKEHGTIPPAKTSGSTGTPVVVERTRLTDLLWNVLTAREHLWHARDTSEPLAVVRYASEAAFPKGLKLDVWGEGAAMIGPPGPCHLLHIGATIEQQVDWLATREFAWLLHYPSAIRELLRATDRRGIRFPRLRGVRTIGEVVTPELREDVRAAWGVPVHDVYSSQELGYVSFECEHGRHHVQAEAIVLEVLRDDGSPCAVGEVGHLVATSLHNLAMPLVRYDFGDLGVLGPPCPCGRGLPVIDRILGRVRQTFVTPDGDRLWFTADIHKVRDLGPVAQHQYVQKALDHLEIRLVADRPPTPAEEAALQAHFASKVPAGTRVTLAWVRSIPRTPSGKFVDFVSELEGS